MTKRIGYGVYEVAPGVIVQHLYGPGEKRDGWQLVIDGEYHDDFALKRDAVASAEIYIEIKRELGTTPRKVQPHRPM